MTLGIDADKMPLFKVNIPKRSNRRSILKPKVTSYYYPTNADTYGKSQNFYTSERRVCHSLTLSSVSHCKDNIKMHDTCV